MKVSSVLNNAVNQAKKQAQKVGQMTETTLQKIGKQAELSQAKNPASSQTAQHNQQVIEGQATERQPHDTQFDDIQGLFRSQFPSISRQVLGKRFGLVDKASRFVMPNGIDQASDTILNAIRECAARLAATENVLAATNSRDIQTLQQDTERSARAGGALKERNKILAAVQGGVSGMTGAIGAAADLPLSVMLSLKTIYEIGHSYGFELDDKEDHAAVLQALSQTDLGLIAEKQTLFLALRALNRVFHEGDFSQLQSYLNTQHSIDQFREFLTDENGNYKWSKLQHLSKLRVFRFATPVIGGVMGAYYNTRLIDAVAEQANQIFAQSRQAIVDNKDHAQLSFAEVYRRQQEKVVPAVPQALTEKSNDQISSDAKTEVKTDEKPATEATQPLAQTQASKEQLTQEQPKQEQSTQEQSKQDQSTQDQSTQDQKTAATQVAKASEAQTSTPAANAEATRTVETQTDETQTQDNAQPQATPQPTVKADTKPEMSTVATPAAVKSDDFKDLYSAAELTTPNAKTTAHPTSATSAPTSAVTPETKAQTDGHTTSQVASSAAISPNSFKDAYSAAEMTTPNGAIADHQPQAKIATAPTAQPVDEQAVKNTTTEKPAESKTATSTQAAQKSTEPKTEAVETASAPTTSTAKSPKESATPATTATDKVESTKKDEHLSDSIVQVEVKTKTKQDKVDDTAVEDVEEKVHSAFEALIKKEVAHHDDDNTNA